MEPDAIEVAWQRVVGAWDDDKAHESFLALCAGLGQLGEAGRRYRDVREREPERAARASRQIDRILGLAMQSLAATKTEPRDRSRRATLLLVAAGVSGAIIASALWALLRML